MRCSLIIKQIFDCVACILSLPILVPIFIFIAITIKIDSAGPALYRGWRTGLYGEPFRIFKFRTMVINADKIGGGTTALKDPRITRVGGLLRKYKLDELPQVLNVIKGDMSLVGPRPELIQYTELYEGDELIILNVRPGITDYSSMKFSALDKVVGTGDADRVFEETVLPEKNKLRIKYVNERTFFKDIKLILQTLYLIFRKTV
jgi:lipopolysaccharide/colanic/teichoic acid biosynthesis glycosyltransferase